MGGMSYEQVAETLCLPVGTLRTWSGKEEISWHGARTEAARALLEDDFSKRKLVVSKVATNSLAQIDRAIDAIAQRAVPPSVVEAEKLASVYNVLEKANRLDLNKSTDNVAVQASVKISLDEIKKILAEDPLAEE